MSEMTIKTASLSEKGQLAIPRDIRIVLGIKKGDMLVLAVSNDKLVIQKATNLEKQTKDDFGDILKYSEKTLEKFWLNKKDDVWEKYLQ